MRRMNITDIPADTQLAGVKINILNRTIHLYGDGGEELQLIEADAQDFSAMCNFVNETLTEEMIEYVY